MSDFAVSMWNHAPKMWAYGRKTGRHPPDLEKDEMRQIIRYLWYTTLFAEPGNPGKGRRVFIGKNCSLCHETAYAGAPDLARVLGARSEPMRPFTVVSVLWQHGPKMLETMRRRRLAWPTFTGSEMSDLIAFLNATMVGNANNRAPDAR
jgi:hypothetical protein